MSALVPKGVREIDGECLTVVDHDAFKCARVTRLFNFTQCKLRRVLDQYLRNRISAGGNAAGGICTSQRLAEIGRIIEQRPYSGIAKYQNPFVDCGIGERGSHHSHRVIATLKGFRNWQCIGNSITKK